MKFFLSGLIVLALFSLLWSPDSEGTDSSSSGASPKDSRHIIIIGLDGISYNTLSKMHESGYFREFGRPIPMVATFPSISDPNWAHLMNAAPEKGYTKAGFDMIKNSDGTLGREYGTLIDHLTTPPQYEKKFDFKAEGVFQHLMSMTWTETSALYWTDSFLRFLMEPKNIKNKSVTSAFIVNTDIISHVGGEKNVINYLKNLAKKIKTFQSDFKAEYKKKLEVVIVSDHGNHFQIPKAIDYKEPLEKKGFLQKSTLKEKTDYAFVAPEIISFGAFYTLPGQEKNLARNFIDIKGVHVALVDNGNDKISVFSKNGESQITVYPKKKTVSYKLISGKDPFDHIHLFKTKKDMLWDDYFFKTVKSTYPNALVRAWEGFYKNSQDKASVLVSSELGYVFTNLTLQILTAVSGVQSTHGSFHRDETLGVIMTTLPHSEEALTSLQFDDWLRTHVTDTSGATFVSARPTTATTARKTRSR
ncbi:MAG: hypothetical protein V4596_08840 [Bdellovibrionota bacterium]